MSEEVPGELFLLLTLAVIKTLKIKNIFYKTNFVYISIVIKNNVDNMNE